jgi:hypothetical protein
MELTGIIKIMELTRMELVKSMIKKLPFVVVDGVVVGKRAVNINID